MLHSTLLLALLLSTRTTTVYALSAHSPKDLFSLPHYAVTFGDHGVLNSTLSPHFSPPSSASEPTLHLIRDAAGQAFLCTVPPDDETGQTLHEQTAGESQVGTKEEVMSEEEIRQKESERQRGLETGLDLLEPMKGSCLFLRQGWFTYSLCYGNELRQFHAIGNPPQEDPHSEAYSLGLSPSPPAARAVPKYGSGSSLEPAKGSPGSRIPATLGGGGEDEDGDELGVVGFGGADAMNTRARYLSQKWDRGTLCDKTGMPRSVEVQFHCSTQSGDRIALVRETAICTYVVLVHTPRLCSEPIFLEGSATSGEITHEVKCEPVVDELRTVVPVEKNPRLQLDDVGKDEEEDNAEGDRGRADLMEKKVEPPNVHLLYYDSVTGKLVDSHVYTQAEYDLLSAVMDGVEDGEKGVMTLEEEIESIRAMEKLAQSMQESLAAALIEPISPTDSNSDPSSSPSSQDEALVQGVDRVKEIIVAINKGLENGAADAKEEEGPSSEKPQVLGDRVETPEVETTADPIPKAEGESVKQGQQGEKTRERDEL